jgi:hypothetical protein
MDKFAAASGVFLLSDEALSAFTEFLLDPRPHDGASFDGNKWELKHSLFDDSYMPYWYLNLVYKPITSMCLNLYLRVYRILNRSFKV